MDHSSEPGRFDRQVEARAETCDRHGEFASRNVIGRIWSRCPTCANEAKAEADRAQDESRQRLREQMQRERLVATAIPRRFIGRSFENFVADTDAKRHALTVARDYAENFAENLQRGAGLVFAGLPGTGKSHLAAAVMQAVMDGNDVLYVTCMDMIRSLRDTWRRDSERTERELLRNLQYLDLLVIDEIGVQYGTDSEQTIVFEVLDRRYRDIKPTILLTNQDRDGFKTFVGDRTFDRLVETSRWVPFDWASYRPTARKAGAA